MLEDRVMVTPPEPAGDASVTVAVEEPPAVTCPGLKLTLAIVAVPAVRGFRLRVANALLAEVAVITIEVVLLTGVVATRNVPLL